MNPRRADIIVAGNAILIAALGQLGRDEIVVCDRALRDGIIVDMVAQDRALADRLGDERVRRIATELASTLALTPERRLDPAYAALVASITRAMEGALAA